MTYKIIVAGYNCYDMIDNCVESIKNQTFTDYDVCMVDDASTDERQAKKVIQHCEENQWEYLIRDKNAGALRSQHEGITRMKPKDGDVIVWVDMDDALHSSESLNILNRHYNNRTLLTYGSYQSVPRSETCPSPARYPRECERRNDYRNLHKWGIRYNHLRTVKWDLYKHLEPKRDFFYNGDWMHLASDAAVMIPCLEMANGRYKFIKDVLYNYTSDNPLSEWRKSPGGTDKMHAAMMAAERRRPI